jgi:hypothetical protein
MTRILLAGAGFSRNWGGLLASEAFEYLLGCDLDPKTRDLLWHCRDQGGGFEDALASLASPNLEPFIADYEPGSRERRLAELTAAIIGMFNAMGLGFKERHLEFQNDGREVKTFLAQFDAIFTLNQDTLLEEHYLDALTFGKFNRHRIPGIKPLGRNANPLANPHAKTAPQQPDHPDNFKLQPGIQPYIKLHGSCNWSDGDTGGRILIMGGHKAVNIGQFPILTWYHDEFRRFLLRPDARLMVIGYSFSDTHINAAIGEGVDKGLKLFIIDPAGVDVLDNKRKKVIGSRREQHMEVLARSVIGASRRPLTSTFNGDVVEHQRVMKFFS